MFHLGLGKSDYTPFCFICTYLLMSWHHLHFGYTDSEDRACMSNYIYGFVQIKRSSLCQYWCKWSCAGPLLNGYIKVLHRRWFQIKSILIINAACICLNVVFIIVCVNQDAEMNRIMISGLVYIFLVLGTLHSGRTGWIMWLQRHWSLLHQGPC